MRTSENFSFLILGLVGAVALSCSSGEKSSSPTMAPVTASGCAGGSPVPDSCCTGGRQVSFTGDCSLTGASVQPVKAALATGATTAGNAQKALETANKMVDPAGTNNGTALAATAGGTHAGTGTTAASRVATPGAGAGLTVPSSGGGGSGSGSAGGGGSSGGGGGSSGLGSVQTAAAAGGPGQPTQLLGDSGSGSGSNGGGGGGGGGSHNRHGDSGMGDLFGNGGGGAGAGASRLQYGAVAGADGKTLAIQDPEDYFDRLTSRDNLFTVVERRYRKTTMDWATAETQQIVNRRSMK